MLQRSSAVLGVLALAGSLACLPAFGPDLRARGEHAGLEPNTSGDRCMGCHVGERQAIHAGVDEDHPAAAPIVADWMLDEPRECVTCHRLRLPPDTRDVSLLPPGVAHVR